MERTEIKRISDDANAHKNVLQWTYLDDKTQTNGSRYKNNSDFDESNTANNRKVLDQKKNYQQWWITMFWVGLRMLYSDFLKFFSILFPFSTLQNYTHSSAHPHITNPIFIQFIFFSLSFRNNRDKLSYFLSLSQHWFYSFQLRSTHTDTHIRWEWGVILHLHQSEIDGNLRIICKCGVRNIQFLFKENQSPISNSHNIVASLLLTRISYSVHFFIDFNYRMIFASFGFVVGQRYQCFPFIAVVAPSFRWFQGVRVRFTLHNFLFLHLPLHSRFAFSL